MYEELQTSRHSGVADITSNIGGAPSAVGKHTGMLKVTDSGMCSTCLLAFLTTLLALLFVCRWRMGLSQYIGLVLFVRLPL